MVAGCWFLRYVTAQELYRNGPRSVVVHVLLIFLLHYVTLEKRELSEGNPNFTCICVH